MTDFDPTVGQAVNSGVVATPRPSLDAAQAEKDRATAYAQVRAINASIAECKARGDVGCLTALRPLLKTWLDKLTDANRRLGATELTYTDRLLVSLDNYIEQAKDAGAKLAGDVGKGVFKAALPFIALAAIFIYLKGKL